MGEPPENTRKAIDMLVGPGESLLQLLWAHQLGLENYIGYIVVGPVMVDDPSLSGEFAKQPGTRKRCKNSKLHCI